MLNEWKRNYRVTMNRAAPAVPAAPGTRANEVFPTVDSRIGWMTDQEIQFSITPACDPFSLYSLVSDTLGEQLESVLNSTMRSDGWDGEISIMLWDAAMYGVGFLKCTWDQALADGYGNVALKATSPWCLYVDPYATSFEDANYIIEVHTMSPSEIERRYPDTPGSAIKDAVDHGRHRPGAHAPDPDGQPPEAGRCPHPDQRRPGTDHLGSARGGQAAHHRTPGRSERL